MSHYRVLLLVLFLIGLIPCPNASGDQPETAGNDVYSAAQLYFIKNVAPNTQHFCGLCHENTAGSYSLAKLYIVPGFPERSILYLNPTGRSYHYKVWPEGTAEAENLKTWIMMEGVVPTPKEFFAQMVAMHTEDNCIACHGNPVDTYDMAKKLIVPGKPMESLLYLSATGKDIRHPKVWPPELPKARALREWIEMETR